MKFLLLLHLANIGLPRGRITSEVEASGRNKDIPNQHPMNAGFFLPCYVKMLSLHLSSQSMQMFDESYSSIVFQLTEEQRDHVESHEEAASELFYLICFSKPCHSSTCKPGRNMQKCSLPRSVITFIWRRYVLRLNLRYWKQAESLENWQSADLWLFAPSQLCIPFSVWLLSSCSENIYWGASISQSSVKTVTWLSFG